MPLNNSYDEQAVIRATASALEMFYKTLIGKIDKLNIRKVMKRKNPYLYRAKAMQNGGNCGICFNGIRKFKRGDDFWELLL